jgi:ELWxxDGT repeat protein
MPPSAHRRAASRSASIEPLERRTLLSLLPLLPAPAGIDPQDFGTVGKLAIFDGTTPAAGRELWASDGTTAGTRLVADLNPGPAGSAPHWQHDAGTYALFTAEAGVAGTGLWRTDGRGRGTRLLVPRAATPWAVNGDNDDGFDGFTPLTSTRTLFFRWTADAGSGREGWEPWVTDGTPGGTFKLGPIASDNPTLAPVTSVGGRAYCFALLGTDGALWQTDGTVAGTKRLSLVNELGGPVEVALLGSSGGVGGKLFVHVDSAAASYLARVDLSPAGDTARLVRVLDADTVYFGGTGQFETLVVAAEPPGVVRFYRFDGTRLTPLKLPPGVSVGVDDFLPGDRLGAAGNLSAVTVGERLLLTLPNGADTLLAPLHLAANRRIESVRFGGASGRELVVAVRTTGRPTRQLLAVSADGAAATPIGTTPRGDFASAAAGVFFAAADATGQNELFAQRPAESTPTQLTEVGATAATVPPAVAMLSVGQDGYVVGRAYGGSEYELWRIPGDGASPIRLLAVATAVTPSQARDAAGPEFAAVGLVADGSRVVVALPTARDHDADALRVDLYRTDGTTAGTVRIARRVRDARPLASLGGRLVVQFTDADRRSRIGAIEPDGSVTSLLRTAGRFGVAIPHAAAGGRAFVLDSGIVYQTDGTPQGTAQVNSAVPVAAKRKLIATDLLAAGKRVIIAGEEARRDSPAAPDRSIAVWDYNPVTGTSRRLRTIGQTPGDTWAGGAIAADGKLRVMVRRPGGANTIYRIDPATKVSRAVEMPATYPAPNLVGEVDAAPLLFAREDPMGRENRTLWLLEPGGGKRKLGAGVIGWAVAGKHLYFQIDSAVYRTTPAGPSDMVGTFDGSYADAHALRFVPFNGGVAIGGRQRGDPLGTVYFRHAPALSVAGQVFADADRDGLLDASESGLLAWRVFVDLDSDGVADPREPSTRTSASGRFELYDLPAGSYTLRAVSAGPAGTTPLSQTVTVREGDTAVRRFGFAT